MVIFLDQPKIFFVRQAWIDCSFDVGWEETSSQLDPDRRSVPDRMNLRPSGAAVKVWLSQWGGPAHLYSSLKTHIICTKALVVALLF